MSSIIIIKLSLKKMSSSSSKKKTKEKNKEDEKRRENIVETRDSAGRKDGRREKPGENRRFIP